MISYLPLLQESNIYLLDSKDLIFFVEIEFFEDFDPKILIEDPEHIYLVH